MYSIFNFVLCIFCYGWPHIYCFHFAHFTPPHSVFSVTTYNMLSNFLIDKLNVLQVYAPWIKHFIYDYNEHDGTETHILPGRDYVTVGGTADRENWDTELCTSNQEKIWQNARRLCPSLLNARLVGDLVGLRPGRDKIRLQMEDGPRGIKVVHNYGHGGSGISLHWGCAGEVVNLLKRAFQNETVTSKL